MSFLASNLAPIMFGSLVLFILIGFPVAFSLAACGFFFGWVGVQLDLVPAALFAALPLRLYGIMSNDTLLAIPFFTFMGLILERSGMAEDLLDTAGQVFGSVRGGLAISVILVGSMLAATTGVVAASVISMGLISLPIMMRYGYNPAVAAGTITASGTLAQIVPPSLVLIVIADQLGQSVGDMYRAAFLPAFMLIGLFVLFIVALALFKPTWVPALPAEARIYREPGGASGSRSLGLLALASAAVGTLFFQQYPALVSAAIGKPYAAPTDEIVVVTLMVSIGFAFVIAVLDRALGLGLLSKIAQRVTFVLIPPLLLVFLVLGTIFLGVATPTEGGAMGAIGALLLAAVRRRIDGSLLKQALDSTTRLSCFVLFILIGSTAFSLSFQGIDGHVWVKHLFDSLPGGVLGFLIFVNVLVFILGCFLDFFEIAFILLPLLLPVVTALGIDPVFFGVMVALNLQTSFLTPPFGFALFYLRSVAPRNAYTDAPTGRRIAGMSTGSIYKGSMMFVALQVLMVVLVIWKPDLVLMGLGEKVKLDTTNIRIEVPAEAEDEEPVNFGTPPPSEGKK